MIRIFKISTERPSIEVYNYASYDVAARTAEEAIKKAKSEFYADERVIEVELLATADF